MSDEIELKLIQESVYDPSKELEARRSLLKRIYSQVVDARRGRERALNNGLLTPTPSCVGEGGLCSDDLGFTYNAIRVLMARYMVKDELGRFLETPSMVMRRVALGFRERVDPERLYRLLVERRFMFNSPTLFNMFVDGARGTLSACYVTPVYDDMESIMDAATVQAKTFKWGGGQGFSFSELRPRWDVVRGTSGYSSGPMSFMRLYDTVTELVKQGGKRRGANMGIMHVWHPDIYTPGFDPAVALRNSLPPQVQELIDAFSRVIKELGDEGYEVPSELVELVEGLSRHGWWTIEDAGFIQAKKPPLQDANLTNFNISVGANDAFMQAVIEGGDWWMVNPRYTASDKTGIYRIHYSVSRATGLGRLGNLIEKHPWLLDNPYLNLYEDVVREALPRALEMLEEQARKSGMPADPRQKNVHAWVVPAREIWKEIVEAAWGGGDPGLVYFDNHNKWSPTPWLGAVNATNPCSEQTLYPFEPCNLGSISVDKYVAEGRFDLERFAGDVEFLTEAMDAVIDLNRHPDERQDRANKFTRKIGLGIMGLADALAGLGYPYDSEEAVAFTTILMAGLEVFSWKRSWEMGARLGHAPAFECSVFDWRSLECREKGSPEVLADLHTPALVKAGMVARFEGEWFKVRYHSLDLTRPSAEVLERVFGARFERDGSVRLVTREALESVARKVFGISEAMAVEAVEMGIEAVGSPRHLLALAVYKPLEAWRLLREYGRRLGAKAPRNTVTTTIAPTGTISILAGTSSGIEPYFALVYKRQVAVGTFLEVVSRFREDLLKAAERYGVGRDALELVYEEVRRHKGSLRWALNVVAEKLEGKVSEGFLEELARLARKYATSMDFPLWYHLAHQIAAQLYVDQAISKTVNLPKTATPEDVEASYLAAWLGGLKGFTVYRDESKGRQVIVFGAQEGGLKGRILRRVRKARMALPRRRLNPREAERDPRLAQVFEVKTVEGDEGVTVELTENSTCKTCHL
ncbi:adenosylcobalamin-dependent ribonucleoside-diphosphate reductase [Aeropyrum camini]|uniref:Vitamin B12-dependent ribonucleotide reductase n=1 Tax=Aeropyrum camini SY1 = JCM 12091 TaxID=1198449 RepID=U3THE6_9CREN|nr:adenosylcobalamin-dependent ribonucleoside-diphosphate reductase [Aeropyrum camini]BAN90754.1 B12-dependent ribonucleotide reductase [Aeropyrum camini SY1 = JCM 12091]